MLQTLWLGCRISVSVTTDALDLPNAVEYAIFLTIDKHIAFFIVHCTLCYEIDDILLLSDGQKMDGLKILQILLLKK